MIISRRDFSAGLVAGAAATLAVTRGAAATASATKVHNVVLVRILEALCGFGHDLQLLEKRQRFAFAFVVDDLLQIDAVEVLHGDERRTVVFAEFVDRDDVLVVQIARCHRLRAKTADEAGIALRGQDFDRDDAFDGGIVAAVHAAEPAVPQFPGYFVTSDPPDHASYCNWDDQRSIRSFAEAGRISV